MKRKLLYIIFTASIFYACNEVSDELNFPITLFPEKISYMSDIRLFTDGKEIFDKEIINHFIEGKRHFNLSDIEDYFLEEINFLSTDSAEILFYQQEADDYIERRYGPYSIEKHNLQFIFHANSHLAFLPWVNVIIPNVNIAYGNYTNLDFSYLAYGMYHYQEYVEGGIMPVSYMSGIIPVAFHEAIIPAVAKKDTLAIQEYRVKYKAK